MGALADRYRVIVRSTGERARWGLPAALGPLDGDVLFMLGGVGGFQFAPLMIRRAIRSLKLSMGTVVCTWQFGLVGEIWTDLMWLRRNRVVAARIARRLLAFRRDHRSARIHLLGYSGGGGVAALVCAALRGRRIIDNLLLIAPALSPDYNLAPALAAVARGTAFVSERDRMLLGLGTRLFGTIDRRHTPAAGMVGFNLPPGASLEDRIAYERFKQVRWSPAFNRLGVSGGHIGWLSEMFIGEVLLPLLIDPATFEASPIITRVAVS